MRHGSSYRSSQREFAKLQHKGTDKRQHWTVFWFLSTARAAFGEVKMTYRPGRWSALAGGAREAAARFGGLIGKVARH